MSYLQEVLCRLPKLAPKELEQVRQRIQLLVSPTAQKVTESDDWFWEGAAAELRRRGVWLRGTPIGFGPHYNKDKASDVRAHLLQGYAKDKPQRAELLALGQLGATVLADWLVKRRIPVRPKTLLGNVEKLPEALEDAFPGYWQARALGICLEKR